MTAAVTVEDVAFAYGRTPVLDGVTFDVPDGRFVALVGPNGSGKSTLIRVLVGLLVADRGAVTVLGRDPRSLDEPWRLGYVPQRPAVADDLPATVAEVVAAGRTARRGWWRRLGATDRAAVDAALAAVSLTDLAARPLTELSGGQQQRAFIAKALASEPDLLVLDEPTAGVDVESQARFRDALVGVRDRGGAVLLVSHELGAVADDLDTVVVLRNGRVSFAGPPSQLTAGGVSLGVHAHDLPVWLEGDHGRD